MSIPRTLSVPALLALVLVLFAANVTRAQDESAPTVPLFAVEFTIGQAWDADKPAHEQAHFREHSANLKRLRESGALLLGARYGKKGLVVLSAASEAEARALIERDPAVQGGTFAFELHPFSVFYGGELPPPRASESSKRAM
ncbi:MAG: YciI family protein [Lysobacteraceae bacterium]